VGGGRRAGASAGREGRGGKDEGERRQGGGGRRRVGGAGVVWGDGGELAPNTETLQITTEVIQLGLIFNAP
jgi:hypothetical protein